LHWAVIGCIDYSVIVIIAVTDIPFVVSVIVFLSRVSGPDTVIYTIVNTIPVNIGVTGITNKIAIKVRLIKVCKGWTVIFFICHPVIVVIIVTGITYSVLISIFLGGVRGGWTVIGGVYTISIRIIVAIRKKQDKITGVGCLDATVVRVEDADIVAIFARNLARWFIKR
jgi:hypothetical protein